MLGFKKGELMFMNRLFFLLFVVLFSTTSVFAQLQFGAIEGMVTEIEGSPIPGVTITASSPSLIGGSAVSYTDSGGHYRFPALSSGTYELKAEWVPNRSPQRHSSLCCSTLSRTHKSERISHTDTNSPRGIEVECLSETRTPEAIVYFDDVGAIENVENIGSNTELTTGEWKPLFHTQVEDVLRRKPVGPTGKSKNQEIPRLYSGHKDPRGPGVAAFMVEEPAGIETPGEAVRPYYFPYDGWIIEQPTVEINRIVGIV